ncbi:hypothetical protein H110_04812 [Trichophyton rubrum MR1448]|nr:hypothetical protein H110_04812 [Trichophyton rubrum MR1448]
MCLAPLRWVKGRRDRSYWKRRIRRMSATLIESRMNGHGAENNNVAGQYQKVATGRAYRLPREHNGNRRLESIPPEGSLRYGRSRHQTLPGSGPNVTSLANSPGEGSTGQQTNVNKAPRTRRHVTRKCLCSHTHIHIPPFSALLER